MYVDSCTYQRGDKTYSRHLLRTSYRQDGKVKHDTVANISNLPQDEIAALKAALSPDKRNRLERFSLKDAEESSFIPTAFAGALVTLNTLARRLGFHEAMGKSEDAALALWLVFARLMGAESRLAAARLAKRHSVKTILGLDGFNEDDLYGALDWLEENQEEIENALLSPKRMPDGRSVFLYDVTSSYLEGVCNELGAFGYNRDGKAGKMQIVIGLLTDADGNPLTVEVFPGNTPDTITCNGKIDEIKRRFNADRVVLVGDRGMIKQPQIDRMRNRADNFDGVINYITAITKPQIETLLKTGVIQMELFDEQIHEIVDGKVRYVIRRNPARAEEIAANRADKLEKLRRLADRKNAYLAGHKKAGVGVALREVKEWIEKLRADKWLDARALNRVISLRVDEAALHKEAKLDGCYVIKTDVVEKEPLTAERIHNLYKDLSQVEWAFRTFKSYLENRPIFVQKENRTKAHVFTVMLAYKLYRALMDPLRPHFQKLLALQFDGGADKQMLTHEDIIEELNFVVEGTLDIAGTRIPKISAPRPMGRKILEILDVKLPVPTVHTNKNTRDG